MASFFSSTTFWSSTKSTIQFSGKTTLLPVRKGDGNEDIEHVPLRELLESRCKSLYKDFKPLWWLRNGHLQTIYCVMGDFTKHDRMSYERTLLRLSEGGTLGLDFAPVDHSSLPDETPIVVVQHGLTGGSYEAYVRAILHRACAPVEEGGLGYRAVVINFRGCAGVPITSQLFYSAGHTDDTRQAMAYIAHRYPKAPLLGLGFSLGSNVLTRYLGEEGSSTRLHACCVLACPWDIKQNSDGLLNSFLGRHIYSKGMGGNLMRLLKRHFNAMVEDPDHHVAKAAYHAITLQNPTLAAFDDAFTRIGGGPSPHFPFPDTDKYYTWGSSHFMLEHVTVPFLAINAADDPIVRYVPMDGAGNELVVMQLTPGGGHLGWFQAGADRVDRWTTEPVLEWLKLMGRDVVHNFDRPTPKLFVGEDDFLREEGKEQLGCKVIEGGGIIDGNGGEDGVLQGL